MAALRVLNTEGADVRGIAQAAVQSKRIQVDTEAICE
jgi:hypothetical protein